MHCTRTYRDCHTTLRIEGVLDGDSAIELRPLIATLVAARQLLVTLDLSSLELMDVLGLAALASLYKRLREVGTSLRVERVQGQPLALIRLLRLEQFLPPNSGDRAGVVAS